MSPLYPTKTNGLLNCRHSSKGATFSKLVAWQTCRSAPGYLASARSERYPPANRFCDAIDHGIRVVEMCRSSPESNGHRVALSGPQRPELERRGGSEHGEARCCTIGLSVVVPGPLSCRKASRVPGTPRKCTPADFAAGDREKAGLPPNPNFLPRCTGKGHRVRHNRAPGRGWEPQAVEYAEAVTIRGCIRCSAAP